MYANESSACMHEKNLRRKAHVAVNNIKHWKMIPVKLNREADHHKVTIKTQKQFLRQSRAFPSTFRGGTYRYVDITLKFRNGLKTSTLKHTLSVTLQKKGVINPISAAHTTHWDATEDPDQDLKSFKKN